MPPYNHTSVVTILDAPQIRPLNITTEACESYNVRNVKLSKGMGTKMGALFSEDCLKVINLDGTTAWVGDYTPEFGLFGQKVIEPGVPAVLVASELEALRLYSAGIKACCLPVTDLDPLTISILADNLALVTTRLVVWPESQFSNRLQAMESFLLKLLDSKQFQIRTLDTTVKVLPAKDATLKGILANATPTEWKPKGIQNTTDIMAQEDFSEAIVGYSTGYPSIDAFTGGLPPAGVTMFTAGTGVGKSTIVREIAYHQVTKVGNKVGMIFLEEPTKHTCYTLAAIMYSVPADQLKEHPELLSKEQWQAFEKHPGIKNNLVYFSHTASLDNSSLFDKIDYMIKHAGCKIICLDHISIVVSGMSSKEGERKDIDILMTRLHEIAVNNQVAIVGVCHLSKPDGTPHEEGGRPTLTELRGSQGIKQLSRLVLAGQRNQQSTYANWVLYWCLKSTHKGKLGPVAVLKFNPDTGRLTEDPSFYPDEFESLICPPKRGYTRGTGGGGAPKLNFGKFDAKY